VVRHGCGGCVLLMMVGREASRWHYFEIVGLSECAGTMWHVIR
jgi:hypothetical protein